MWTNLKLFQKPLDILSSGILLQPIVVLVKLLA